MKYLITTAALFICSFFYGQSNYDETKISSGIKKVVNKMIKENILSSEFVGYSGSKSGQFENFESLRKKATPEELLMLTNHKNGIVRCYSFWALGFLPNINMLEIVKNHLNDNEIIKSQSGCIVSSEKVGDFYISLVTPEYIDIEVKKLNESERKVLDSLLIYTPNELNARYQVIESAEPTPQLYPILRKLYLTNHNQSALVTLSKYKREEDIDLILKNRDESENKESGYYHTYRAIQNFPREEFVPFLENRVNETLDNALFSNEWRELYSAIVAYKTQKSLELLSIPFSKVQHENIKKYHLDFIYDAILENYDSIYAELLWKVWEQNQNISLEGYRFYIENDLKRAYNMTVKELSGNSTANSSPVFDSNIFTDNLEESMMNLVLLNDKDLAHQIIKLQISKARVHEFPIYTSIVKKSKDLSFVNDLFERLATEWNAYVYLEIVETLLLFQDETINNRIIATKKINLKLNEGWGGEALTDLLEKNNVK